MLSYKLFDWAVEFLVRTNCRKYNRDILEAAMFSTIRARCKRIYDKKEPLNADK